MESQPGRTTEVVTVRSDGRSLTSGTRQQTEFLSPALFAPDGTQVSDDATVRRAAGLVGSAGKGRVLSSRPPAPDASITADRKPFNAQGVYVLYNASAPLQATVLVQCAGQEQRWAFSGEGNPTAGQVNCAVEPSTKNAVAHLVYTDNCD